MKFKKKLEEDFLLEDKEVEVESLMKETGYSRAVCEALWEVDNGFYTKMSLKDSLEEIDRILR